MIFINVCFYTAFPHDILLTVNDVLSNTQVSQKELSYTFHTFPTATISCTVSKYYPSVTLVFRHGSKLAEHAEIKEWVNDDETKNKSISIRVEASMEPFLCVVSEIPGARKREVTRTIYILPPVEKALTTSAMKLPPAKNNKVLILMIGR